MRVWMNGWMETHPSVCGHRVHTPGRRRRPPLTNPTPSLKPPTNRHQAAWIKWFSYLRFPFQALYQNAIRGTASERTYIHTTDVSMYWFVVSIYTQSTATERTYIQADASIYLSIYLFRPKFPNAPLNNQSTNHPTTQPSTPKHKQTALLHFAEFDQPPTVGLNIGASMVFYSIFFVLGYLGLAYLHKERR